MAKKQLSFLELDNLLTKNVDSRGSIITNNAFSQIDEWIGSGNYLLNAQLSGSLFGGYPNSRSVALAGETGTGKTFLALNACREAQKLGYSIIYCDSEAAIDLENVKKFGIDSDYFRYQPINTPREFRFFVANLIDKLKDVKKGGGEYPKIMLVLDSLGNLSTDKSRRDALSGSDKKDMTKQQELKSLFANVTMDLAEYKIPFILTAHTYEAVGSFFPKKVMGGGSGALYNTSIINFLYKAKLGESDESKKVGMKKSGIVVRSAPEKNRFARPITIRFHISFYRGMNPYVGLEQFISWENCGIAKGNIFTKKEFDKWKTGKEEAIEKGYTWTDENGEFHAFWPKETARNYVVKHLNGTVKANEVFTSRVLTKDLLIELDEKIIKPTFQLPKVGELNEGFEELLEDAPELNVEPKSVEEQLEETLVEEKIVEEKIEEETVKEEKVEDEKS